VKTTLYLLCAFALAFAIWPLGRPGAAPRCYPTKRFVVLADGLVSDTLTKLVWQQQASSTGMSWAAAQTFCPSGFRVPTLKELVSIVDYTVPVPGPAIDQTAFPNAWASPFWTSSPSAGSSDLAYYVYFGNGYASRSEVSSTFLVRCVR
jgi:hypothetical protein